MSTIESILHDGEELAIIVRNEYTADGVNFFTNPEYSQQLAYMRHKKGHKIKAHRHNEVERTVVKTNEVLLIKKGCLKVDFFTDVGAKVCSRFLESGDIILLIAGGHGFEAVEEVEFFEVKQGPYSGDSDKKHF